MPSSNETSTSGSGKSSTSRPKLDRKKLTNDANEYTKKETVQELSKPERMEGYKKKLLGAAKEMKKQDDEYKRNLYENPQQLESQATPKQQPKREKHHPKK
jgi:hypothetical protein